MQWSVCYLPKATAQQSRRSSPSAGCITATGSDFCRGSHTFTAPTHTDRQTDITATGSDFCRGSHTLTAPTHTERQCGKQTDRQTGRQAGRQAGRQTDRQTDITATGSDFCRGSHTFTASTHTDRNGMTEGWMDRQTEAKKIFLNYIKLTPKRFKIQKYNWRIPSRPAVQISGAPSPMPRPATPSIALIISRWAWTEYTGKSSFSRFLQQHIYQPGARFTKYLTIIIRLS